MLLDRVRSRLAAGEGPVTAARVAEAVRQEGGALVGDVELLELTRALQRDIAGAGPLEPLLADPAVTDVLVNGPSSVWVDPRLPDGVRLHAVLPPVAPDGPYLSLRVPRRRAFALPELVAAGGLPPDGAALLGRLVAARASFVVSGGTGTGKTTLLAALLSLVSAQERLLLVEDSAELAPEHPHVVRLEGRPANVEGAGAVVLQDLVRQALRMRPDRLVVGEVRGAEVVDLLAALNTGHDGGCATVHAGSAVSVPARLEALATAAGLDRGALHSQLAAGLQAVVHLVRAGGRRRLAEVAVLARGDDGLVRARTGWSWDGTAPTGAPGPAADGLAALVEARP
jgi:pilus assembly protein CpaF